MSHRYLPLTAEDKQVMLDAIGVESMGDLFVDIPDEVLRKEPLQMKRALSESELTKEFHRLASKNMNNKTAVSFLGAGVYDHYLPVIVDQMLMRSEFYTAYTPYQPEISQGELQAIFEFQTMICELTGMDVTNASMYDGATALAEAAMLSCGHTKRKKVLVSAAVHPEYRDVVRSYAKGQHVEYEEVPVVNGVTDLVALQELISKEYGAVLVQYPNFFGQVEDLEAIHEVIRESGALYIVNTNPLALGVLEPPASFGADIVTGDTQVFGIPTQFGGPHCGFLAVKNTLMRKVPGRLVGQTVDEEGRRGFVLTLQAREQHIRREKATSNICSNQALNALASSICMSVLGPNGVHEMAVQNMSKAQYAIGEFKAAGYQVLHGEAVFNEFVIKCKGDVDELNAYLRTKNILGGLKLDSVQYGMLVCVTEQRTKEEIDLFVREVAGYYAKQQSVSSSI